MLDREHLETFATVIEEKSFERAASVLNVTRGAVSQRVKALEESLATVLVVRERPVAQTAAGEVLLRHVKALRLLENSTLSELNPQDKRVAPVPVAIAVNADSLATWFPRVLWPLLQRHRLAIEVISDDQDHTLQRLVKGEVLGCLSTEAKPANGFVAEALGEMEYRCCATPAFANDHFRHGLTVAAVLESPSVLFNRKDSLHDEFLEQLFGFRVERYGRHYVPAPAVLLDAILAGVGYGLVPSMQAQHQLDSGDLVDLAPTKPSRVPLYWHHWAAEPSFAQEITHHIVEGARQALGTADC